MYAIFNSDVNGNYLELYILNIKDAINSAYSFTSGDYVNVIATFSDTTYTLKSIGPQSFKIVGQLDLSNLNKIYISGNFGAITKSDYYFVEIIRPLQGASNLFFECGPVFDINNGLHTGNLQTQTSDIPALVYLTKGDFFRLRKYMFGGNHNNGIIYVESSSESDFYVSNYWGNGRINVPIEQVGGGFLNNTLMSEKYVPNTQQNGLATFDWQESSNEANERFGTINKSIVVGDVFKIIQKDKITSYYIGHDIAQSGDGTNTCIRKIILN